jgi:hypothetical protein
VIVFSYLTYTAQLFIFQKGKSLVDHISFYGEGFGTVITLCNTLRGILRLMDLSVTGKRGKSLDSLLILIQSLNSNRVEEEPVPDCFEAVLFIFLELNRNFGDVKGSRIVGYIACNKTS